MAATLEELGVKYGTDKAEALGFHHYCPIYDELFTPWRDEPITLLELGWGGYGDPRRGGCSAAMWREYFTKAAIYFIDMTPKIRVIPGVELFHGSQDDRKFLAEMHEQTGDYDIVIDDASHESFLTIKSFSLLWPWVRPNGVYIVEDLQVQEGAAKRFARLAEEQVRALRDDIASITFHREMLIVRKKA